jgi:hypothetical protein
MNTNEVYSRPSNRFVDTLKNNLSFFGILFVSYFEIYAMKSQVVLNSDTLYMHYLSKDLLDGGSFLDWNLTQAPDYFPHMFFYLIISLFTHHAAAQLFFITLFQAYTLCTLFFLIFRILGHSKFVSFFESISLLTLINLFQLHSQDWVYFYKTNNHFSSVILGLFVLMLLLNSAQSNPLKQSHFQVIFFFLVILGTLSTITFIFAVALPLVWIVTKEVFLNPNLSFRGISYLLIIFSGTVVALFLTANTSSGLSLKSRVGSPGSGFVLAQELFVKAFTRNVIHSGLIVRFIFILTLASLIFLLFGYFLCDYKSFPNPRVSKNFSLLFSFSITSLISSSLLTILSGGMVDEYFLRYFWPSIFFCGVTITFLVTEFLSKTRKDYLRGYRLEVLILGSILILYSIAGKPIYNNGSPFEATAKCLISLKVKGINLENGVADYWYARSIDFFSSGRIQIFPALNTLQPFYWMTSLESFKKDSYYNFILLHSSPEPFNFNYENMKEILPSTFERYKCMDTDISVYVYNDGSLNAMMQASRQSFMDSLK